MAEQITFFCPSRTVGGTATLFVGLARYLAQQGYGVRYYDYASGYSDNQLRGVENVEMLHVADDDTPMRIEPIGTLVLYLSNLFSVGRGLEIPSDARVLLWCLHPTNILMGTPFHVLYSRMPPRMVASLMARAQPRRLAQLRQLLTLGATHHSLCFMDRESRLFTQTVTGAKLPDEAYLPVSVADDSPLQKSDFGDHRPLRVGWLGRMPADKLPTIVSAIEALREHSERTNTAYELHLIGDGSRRRVVESIKTGSHIQRIMHGSLLGEALDEALRPLDLVIAMGISALTAARLGVPTVIPVHRQSSIPKGGFRAQWIHDVEGFDASIHYEREDVPGMPTMSDLLTAIADTKVARRHGQRSMSYCRQHHMVPAVAAQLVKAMNRGSLTMADIERSGVLERSAVESMAYRAKPLWNAVFARPRATYPVG